MPGPAWNSIHSLTLSSQLFIGWDGGLANFLEDQAQTVILLISDSLIAGIAGMGPAHSFTLLFLNLLSPILIFIWTLLIYYSFHVFLKFGFLKMGM
jgi:hypothetical protein